MRTGILTVQTINRPPLIIGALANPKVRWALNVSDSSDIRSKCSVKGTTMHSLAVRLRFLLLA
jgi:hypothetical protein